MSRCVILSRAAGLLTDRKGQANSGSSSLYRVQLRRQQFHWDTDITKLLVLDRMPPVCLAVQEPNACDGVPRAVSPSSVTLPLNSSSTFRSVVRTSPAHIHRYHHHNCPPGVRDRTSHQAPRIGLECKRATEKWFRAVSFVVWY